MGMWVSGELEVEMWGCFTTHHHMRAGTRFLGELVLPALGKAGKFRFYDGRELVVEKASWWRGWHELQENGIVIGSARPLGFWGQRMSVGFRGKMYELESAGFWSDSWQLIDESDTVVMEVRRRGFFRRKVRLAAHEAVSPDLLVFVYYLVNVRWQEQSAAAAAVAAGS
jgi:hypothetical protein